MLVLGNVVQELRDKELTARTESLALTGKLDQAIGLFRNVKLLQKLDSLK